MKFIRLAVAASLVLFLSGCAGIIHGNDQVLTFNSEPAGAEVLLDGVSVGVTPLSTKVKKNAKSTVMIKKDGYSAQTLPLGKHFDSIAILNVFWDLSTTDMITGAAYEYDPNTYYVKLMKTEAAQ